MEPRLSQPTPSILSIVFQVHGGLCAPGAAARSYGGKQLGGKQLGVGQERHHTSKWKCQRAWWICGEIK